MTKPRPSDYLDRIPDAVPAGMIVVHNHVRPTRRLGTRGFRAWLAERGDDRYVECGCGWAPELGEHYRVLRIVRRDVDSETGRAIDAEFESFLADLPPEHPARCGDHAIAQEAYDAIADRITRLKDRIR